MDDAKEIALQAHGEIGHLRARIWELEHRPGAPARLDNELYALWWAVVLVCVAVWVLARRVNRIEDETEVVDAD